MPRIQQYLTTGDIWTYPQRTLTQAKFQFWSAIITQTQGSVSVAAGATVNVDVQPPAGETWLVSFGAWDTTSNGTYVSSVEYLAYDGTTEKSVRKWYNNASNHNPNISHTAILTNSLYARLKFYSSNASTGYYGYSGFKLSQPHWTPKRTLATDSDPETVPWLKPTEQPITDMLKPLSKHIVDVWDGVQGKYVQAILLEKDTVLAVEPTTGFPVERMTAYIDTETFIKRYTEFKADPDSTGYRKYFKKWAEEGISI